MGHIRIGKPKPDKKLAIDQLQALQAMVKAFGMEFFIAAMIWILAKKASDIPGVEKSRLMPFRFNLMQHHLYSDLGQHNRLLKMRQGGSTTFFTLVRLFVPIILEEGKTGLLISQNSAYASKHFQMVRRAYRYFGAQNPHNDEVNGLCTSLKNNLLHTVYSNRRELEFDMLDSRIMVESAEVEEAGQGVTLHHVVSSETSRWPGQPEETTSNIKGALVTDGTYDEECTANGMGGYFCEAYLRSMESQIADAKPHFYEWYWDNSYSLKLTPKQAKELEDDLTTEEYAIIRQIHSCMSSVEYN